MILGRRIMNELEILREEVAIAAGESSKHSVTDEHKRRNFWHKVSLLLVARDKAHNVEFKILWNDKIKELLSSHLA